MPSVNDGSQNACNVSSVATTTTCGAIKQMLKSDVHTHIGIYKTAFRVGFFFAFVSVLKW